MNKFAVLSVVVMAALVFLMPLQAQERVTKEESEQAKVIAQLANRIDELEASTNRKLNALSSAADASINANAAADVEQDKKIAELERKVAGMQKQITILHAKKANKKD